MLELLSGGKSEALTTWKPDPVCFPLEHILEASNNIQTYVEGYDFYEFAEDIRTQQAVIMNFIIIGEAAAKIMDKYPDFAQNTSHISWLGMRGMRNRIAHGYFEIDLAVVWETVQQAVPVLIVQLKRLLAGSASTGKW